MFGLTRIRCSVESFPDSGQNANYIFSLKCICIDIYLKYSLLSFFNIGNENLKADKTLNRGFYLGRIRSDFG